MKVKAVTPILNVTSLADSFAWFERLGWEKRWEHGDPPDFGSVGHARAEIFLCQGGQGLRGGALPKEPWDKHAGATWMTWWLPTPADVDSAYERAVALGIPAPWPPTDMPWNVRECHIRHPDGHTFRVSALLEEG